MDLNLTGKRALVCGSSQGIGKGIALALAELGANVVLFARNRQTLAEVKAQLACDSGQQHEILAADFADPAAVKSAIEQYLAGGNTIEILVNNTGGPAPGPIHQAEAEAFSAAFNQHVVNNQNLTQALLPGMKASGYGRIINVISTSVKQPLPNLGVSNTIRGAVASWAKTMANELGPFNITVNNVLPGATKTARLDAIIDAKAKKQGIDFEQMAQQEREGIPLRRFGEVAEFANAVAFLASPAAAYITGVNLPVDGGRTGSL